MSAPTACRRSVLSVPRAWRRSTRGFNQQRSCRAVACSAVVVFYIGTNFDPDMDFCPTLQDQNFATLAGVFNALKLCK